MIVMMLGRISSKAAMPVGIPALNRGDATMQRGCSVGSAAYGARGGDARLQGCSDAQIYDMMLMRWLCGLEARR